MSDESSGSTGIREASTAKHDIEPSGRRRGEFEDHWRRSTDQGFSETPPCGRHV